MSTLILKSNDFHSLASQLLTAGNTIRFQASGSSMLPFIRNGDILEVIPVHDRRIEPGDIVFLKTESENILVHRVIKIQTKDHHPIYLIKGDSTQQPDGWFPASQIAGLAVAIERQSRRIILTSRTQRIRSWLWIRLAPVSTRVQWLPQKIRVFFRQLLIGIYRI